MKIYFVRHGLANRSQWKGSDEKRPLTSKGVEKIKIEAKVLARMEIQPSYIITSPYMRALQTAQLIAKELNMEENLIEDERLAPGFGLDELKEILKDKKEIDDIVLVGHEPDFSICVGKLIGNGRIVMNKGSIACVDVNFYPSISGELIWLATPYILLQTPA